MGRFDSPKKTPPKKKKTLAGVPALASVAGRPLDSGRTSIAIYSRWRKRIRERWITQPDGMAPTLVRAT